MLAARAVALACALVGSAAYTVVPDTAINLVGDSSDAANRMEMRKAEMAKMQEQHRAEREKMKAQKEEMRAAEKAPRGPFHVLKRRHGLAEIVKRGGGVRVERLPVKQPHLEREIMTLSENSSRRAHHAAQISLGFFEAPQTNEQLRDVVGFMKGIQMFCAVEL